jgi:hypothetical protein
MLRPLLARIVRAPSSTLPLPLSSATHAHTHGPLPVAATTTGGVVACTMNENQWQCRMASLHHSHQRGFATSVSSSRRTRSEAKNERKRSPKRSGDNNKQASGNVDDVSKSSPSTSPSSMTTTEVATSAPTPTAESPMVSDGSNGSGSDDDISSSSQIRILAAAHTRNPITLMSGIPEWEPLTDRHISTIFVSLSRMNIHQSLDSLPNWQRLVDRTLSIPTNGVGIGTLLVSYAKLRVDTCSPQLISRALTLLPTVINQLGTQLLANVLWSFVILHGRFLHLLKDTPTLTLSSLLTLLVQRAITVIGDTNRVRERKMEQVSYYLI